MSRKIPNKAERYFTTGLSMITSIGVNGPNIMTAEWTMQISYQPVLIAVFIHKGSETLKNIEKTKEFGVNVASQEQTSEVSVAGGYSGTELDKLKIKNIFKISKPRKIKTPMIAGCIINAECRLVKKEQFGDHFMVVGRIIHIRHDDFPPLSLFPVMTAADLKAELVMPSQQLLTVVEDAISLHTM